MMPKLHADATSPAAATADTALKRNATGQARQAGRREFAIATHAKGFTWTTGSCLHLKQQVHKCSWQVELCETPNHTASLTCIPSQRHVHKGPLAVRHAAAARAPAAHGTLLHWGPVCRWRMIPRSQCTWQARRLTLGTRLPVWLVAVVQAIRVSHQLHMTSADRRLLQRGSW